MVARPGSDAESDRLLTRGEVSFVLHVPTGFEHRLLRGERPSVLLEADATDPAATASALGAIQQIMDRVLDPDLRGAGSAWKARPGPVDLRVHRRYNPEGITQALFPGCSASC